MFSHFLSVSPPFLTGSKLIDQGCHTITLINGTRVLAFSKPKSDTFLLKQLEKSVKKSEESLKKIDKEYHDCCRKAESCRQEWEATIYKVHKLFTWSKHIELYGHILVV